MRKIEKDERVLAGLSEEGSCRMQGAERIESCEQIRSTHRGLRLQVLGVLRKRQAGA